MERDEQSLLMSTLKPKLHTERPFLNMFVAASILTARNIYMFGGIYNCVFLGGSIIDYFWEDL